MLRHLRQISSSCRPAEKEEHTPLGELAWDVDQGLIAQLKEQYRKERKGKKGVKSKSSFSSLSFSSSDSLWFLPDPPVELNSTASHQRSTGKFLNFFPPLFLIYSLSRRTQTLHILFSLCSICFPLIPCFCFLL